MKDKFIILIGDPETDSWSVAVNTEDQDVALDEYRVLKHDGTPVIMLYTGDFVTV